MLDFFRSLFSPPRDLILPILAAWVGLLLAERRSERYLVTREILNHLIFHGLIGYLIGGRLIYVFGNLPAFTASPVSLLSPNPALFDIAGACLGAGVAGVLVFRSNQIPILNTLDALTPFFAIVAVGIALMHLAAGTAYGLPTRVPWAVHLWGALRHPSQIYEALAAFGIFIIIWRVNFRFKPGITFLLFVSFSAAERLFLEAFRGDSNFLPGGFRQAQVVAIFILIACFIFIEVIQTNHQ